MSERSVRQHRSVCVLIVLLAGGTGCRLLLTRFPEVRTSVAIRAAEEACDVREAREDRARRLRDDVQSIAFERSHQRREALDRARRTIERQLDLVARLDGRILRVTHPYAIEVPWLDAIRRRADISKCAECWEDQKREMLEGEFHNVELVVPGDDPDAPAIVVGAHYDSDTCESQGVNPGADDNASGVAALIELARMAAEKPRARTIRFVAFTNEEEPFFHTPGTTLPSSATIARRGSWSA